jgi:hypothetical protein
MIQRYILDYGDDWELENSEKKLVKDKDGNIILYADLLASLRRAREKVETREDKRGTFLSDEELAKEAEDEAVISIIDEEIKEAGA